MRQQLANEEQMRQQLAKVQQEAEFYENRVQEAKAELAARRRFFEENAPPEIRHRLPEIFGEECSPPRIEELED
jgi:hypothetical protein